MLLLLVRYCNIPVLRKDLLAALLNAGSAERLSDDTRSRISVGW